MQKAQLLIPNLCIVNSYHAKSKRKKKLYSIMHRAQLLCPFPLFHILVDIRTDGMILFCLQQELQAKYEALGCGTV